MDDISSKGADRANLYQSSINVAPDTVVVTLYTDDHGTIRGTYRLPPLISDGFKLTDTTVEYDLLAPIALLRAANLARLLKMDLSIVDPQDLWSALED